MTKKRAECIVFFLILILSLAGCMKGKETSGKETAGNQTKISMTADELKEKYSDSEEYIFKDKVFSVGINDSFTFKTKMQENGWFEKKFPEALWPTPFVVYKDYNFTEPLFSVTNDPEVDDSKSETNEDAEGLTGTIKITPEGQLAESVLLQNRDNYELKLSGDGSWGIYDSLYLVQYNDMGTGKLLEKPYVYLIKVKHSGEVASPEISMTVTDDGRLKLSWDPVEGATSYMIIKETRKIVDEDVTKISRDRYGLLGEVETNSWFSENGGEDDSRGMLQAFTYSDDDRNNPHNKGDLKIQESASEPLDQYRLFVLAMNEDGVVSPMSNYISSGDFIEKLPVGFAWYTFEKEYGGITEAGKLPDSLPVIMADGSIRKYSVDYKKEQAKRTKYKNKELYSTDLPYQINKTTITGAFNTTENMDDAAYEKVVDDKIASIKKADQTGRLEETVNVAAAGDIKIDKKSYSDSIPEIPVKIVADSALEEYLAANIIAGKQYIDISKFPEARDKNVLDDTYNTVRKKNMLLPSVFLYYSDKEQVLQISYSDYERSETGKIQDKVVDVVKEVTNDNMSELEKVTALNQYLVDHAEYDYDSLKEVQKMEQLQTKGSDDEASKIGGQLMVNPSFEAKGILLDQKGVCAGYAKAFTVLATQAGLDCVYVTGEASSGDGHAWNYVKIDGQWRVVDVTWNDTGGPDHTQDYLNLALDDPLYTNSHYPDAQFNIN